MLFRNIHKAYGIASAVLIASLLLAPLAAFASSPPDAPTGLSATPGDSSASLSWSAPENTGSSSITGYKVEDSLHSAPLNFTKLYDAGVISADNGTGPLGNVLPFNGKLYGMTYQGGSHEDGTIFSLDPSGNVFTVLHDFDSDADGEQPEGNLIQVGGILYGMTHAGGANGVGTLFSFDPSGNTYTKLYDFSAATGDHPLGTLINVGGVLYGETETDGAGDSGVIFSYNLSTNTYTDVHDLLQNSEGANPNGALINVGGILYGTAQTGGVHGGGTIFTLDPSDNAFADAYSFDGGADGTAPAPYLTSSGNIIYGTTLFGGTPGAGTIFSFNASTTALTTLFSFDGGPQGSNPEGGLIDVSGVLYGTTQSNGANDDGGTVYSYAISGNTFTDIHDFNNSDPDNGGNMQGGVVNVGGTLYGLTGENLFFSIAPSGSNFTVVHSFSDPITIGGSPGKTLLPYQGLLYGVMGAGGAHDDGVIFSFDPSDDTYHDLYELADADGSTPVGGLINVGGIFYGLTSQDGSLDSGTLFSFDPSNNTFTKLYDLDPDAVGDNPFGTLVNINGVLYGMTLGSGPGNGGAIFSYNISSHAVTDVHDLSTEDGNFPSGSLINVNGILYGLASSNGSDGGTIFSFNPSGGAFSVLHAFSNSSDGGSPQDNLLNVNGVLYGLTEVGGANDDGTIFSYNLSNNTFTKLHDFNTTTEGDGPNGSLVESGGVLYGATGEGGPGDVGDIFSFDPSNNAFTVIRSLDRDTDGAFADGTFTDLGGTLYGTLNEGGANDDGGTLFSLSKNWTATQQSGTATTGTVSGLTNDTEYDFRVSATNSTGTGIPSDIATTTPEAAGGSNDSGGGNATTTAPTRIGGDGISGGQIVSTPATRANTVANLQAELKTLLAQLAALQGMVAPSSGTTTSSTYTRDLQLGDSGADVTSLQNFLIAKGYPISAGATGYFGSQTQTALAAYQKASGIAPAAGYFGPLTRAYIASH